MNHFGGVINYDSVHTYDMLNEAVFHDLDTVSCLTGDVLQYTEKCSAASNG